jgi:hypothetical protein
MVLSGFRGPELNLLMKLSDRQSFKWCEGDVAPKIVERHVILLIELRLGDLTRFFFQILCSASCVDEQSVITF